MTTLDTFVRYHAHHTPDALAVKGPDRALTYAELDRQAGWVARMLAAHHLRKGDRVGIWLDKSTNAVACMQGTLRIGAIYIPLDPLSPAFRIRQILQDCQVSLLISTRKRTASVLTGDRVAVPSFCIEDLEQWQTEESEAESVCAPEPADLAYILYTSGSTGAPKGICISHQNALAFIQWAVAELHITAQDRLSNHAPFHFDLSVLDLYGAFSAGASVFLIPDGISYLPQQLLAYILRERITIWYSVPSALILMLTPPGICDLDQLPLRAILFAGEPFPLKQLRPFYQRWSATVRFLNLYGPTETNVCTFFEVHSLDKSSDRSLPIGRACSGDQVWAIKDDGSLAVAGEEGELVVAGPTVMHGYWGQPPQGNAPYRTGDRVRLEDDGNYTYLGRRDQMVKLHGHRIELAEVEVTLGKHPAIREVVAVIRGYGLDARLVVCVVSGEDPPPSLLQLKKYCAEHLPRYMIIDAVEFFPSLPRTRNGKINRLELANPLSAK